MVEDGGPLVTAPIRNADASAASCAPRGRIVSRVWGVRDFLLWALLFAPRVSLGPRYRSRDGRRRLPLAPLRIRDELPIGSGRSLAPVRSAHSTCPPCRRKDLTEDQVQGLLTKP